MVKRKELSVDELLKLQSDSPSKRRKTESLLSGNTAKEDLDSEVDEASEDASSDAETPAEAGRIGLEEATTLDISTKPTPIHRRVDNSQKGVQRSFAELGVSSPIVAALSAMSIKRPTPVQNACIPALLQGRDCVGNAKTGSGKTVAFAVPILQRLSEDPYGVFALVLTPTRELAFQISEQFAAIGSPLLVRTVVVVGGMDMIAQAIELEQRPHVIIATPGRIVDHLKSSSDGWNLSRVRFLILDEADRLLTSTFSDDLKYIFSALPKDRQTALFTATLTQSIEDLGQAPPRPGRSKPFIHRMKETVETVETLQQYYTLIPSRVREAYLFHLLCNPPESTISLRRAPPENKSNSRKKSSAKAKEEDAIIQPPPTIIFVNRPKTAAFLTSTLQRLGIRSTALHSRLTQRARLTSLNLFRASVVPVLISTDVGARGLDIEDVAIVINWDLPSEPEEYTHRVGRTARAGRNGVAISFVTERDEEKVLKIEDRIKTQLDEITFPEAKVLEKLNAVSTAKRLAKMELHDNDFGKREAIHDVKKVAG